MNDAAGIGDNVGRTMRTLELAILASGRAFDDSAGCFPLEPAYFEDSLIAVCV